VINTDFKAFLSLILVAPYFLLICALPALPSDEFLFWPCCVASYCSAVVAIWADVTSWRGRLAALCTGSGIAFFMGIIATTIAGSTVYGAVTFLFSAIPGSIAASQAYLGRFDKDAGERRKRRIYAILLGHVLLCVGLLIVTAPYLMFPWFLGIGVVCTSACLLVWPSNTELSGGRRIAVSIVSPFLAYLCMYAISDTTQSLYLNLLK
jgi:hypothetical protein